MTWIQTQWDVAFDLANPREEDVSILDIAHHLSRLRRFTGARDYTVLSHSMYVAYRLLSSTLDYGLALQGLLHDAHEAYVGDVSGPAKYAMRLLHDGAESSYDILEDRVCRVVRRALGVPEELDPRVHEADMRALASEQRDLFQYTPKSWRLKHEPYPQPITFDDGPMEFIAMYQYLTEKCDEAAAK